MKYRNLGKSGLRVPILSLGTATFGGTNEFFQRWGETDVKKGSRLIDICIERGVNFFDTANVYSQGESEKILGKTIKGKREKTIISTKGSFEMGKGINDKGSSRSLNRYLPKQQTTIVKKPFKLSNLENSVVIRLNSKFNFKI